MNYNGAIDYLYGLGHEVLDARYGLVSIERLLSELGDPQRSFQAIIVAGTNGKGSISASIDSILRKADIRTGLYTSPHLMRLEERIVASGEQISADEFAEAATEIRAAGEALVNRGELAAVPTFFEQLTAIAMLFFKSKRVELAVLEVGVGGGRDAVNAVTPVVAIVGSVGFDHQDILGPHITQIAGEKAAVIKPGSRAVIGSQRYRAATDVIMQRCLDVGVLPVFCNEPRNLSTGWNGFLRFDYSSAGESYAGVQLGLRGRHQADNAAAAIEAVGLLRELGWNIQREHVSSGLRDVCWPGRLEFEPGRPPMLLDCAHNVDGARCLREYLEEHQYGRLTLVFGSMADKDLEGISRQLFGLAGTVVVTRICNRRAASSAQIGKWAIELARNVIFTETVPQALSWARSLTPPDGLICVAGSLQLVGEIKAALDREDDQRTWIR